MRQLKDELTVVMLYGATACKYNMVEFRAKVKIHKYSENNSTGECGQGQVLLIYTCMHRYIDTQIHRYIHILRINSMKNKWS